MALDRIDIVFFDFDGVILESAGIKTAAFREVFDDAPESVRFHLENQGVSRFEKFRFHCEQVLGRAYDATAEREMNDAFDAIVQHQVDTAAFVPGAFELLEALQHRIPAFVASGTPENELVRIVQVRGLDPYFAGVHGSPRRKGEIASAVLSQRGVPPHRGLFIGDALADYEGALEAGLPFVGRVAESEESPFPVSTATVCDLMPLLGDWAGISERVGAEFATRSAG